MKYDCNLLNTGVSQGSVATRLRRGRVFLFHNHFITDLLPSVQMKEFCKSVKRFMKLWCINLDCLLFVTTRNNYTVKRWRCNYLNCREWYRFIFRRASMWVLSYRIKHQRFSTLKMLLVGVDGRGWLRFTYSQSGYCKATAGTFCWRCYGNYYERKAIDGYWSE